MCPNEDAPTGQSNHKDKRLLCLPELRRVVNGTATLEEEKVVDEAWSEAHEMFDLMQEIQRGKADEKTIERVNQYIESTIRNGLYSPMATKDTNKENDESQ